MFHYLIPHATKSGLLGLQPRVKSLRSSYTELYPQRAVDRSEESVTSRYLCQSERGEDLEGLAQKSGTCLEVLHFAQVLSNLVSLSLRLKDLLGPVTRVKKKKKKRYATKGGLWVARRRERVASRYLRQSERGEDVEGRTRSCISV